VVNLLNGILQVDNNQLRAKLPKNLNGMPKGKLLLESEDYLEKHQLQDIWYREPQTGLEKPQLQVELLKELDGMIKLQ